YVLRIEAMKIATYIVEAPEVIVFSRLSVGKNLRALESIIQQRTSVFKEVLDLDVERAHTDLVQNAKKVWVGRAHGRLEVDDRKRAVPPHVACKRPILL